MSDLLRMFALPPFRRLAEAAPGREERGRFGVVCGSVIEGRDGPIGLNLEVGGRQSRYWLPIDHPRFQEIHDTARLASSHRTLLDMSLDPVARIVLEASVPPPADPELPARSRSDARLQ